MLVPYVVPVGEAQTDPWARHTAVDFMLLRQRVDLLRIEEEAALAKKLRLHEYVALNQTVAISLIDWIGDGLDNYYSMVTKLGGMPVMISLALAKAVKDYTEEKDKAYREERKKLMLDQQTNPAELKFGNTNSAIKGVF